MLSLAFFVAGGALVGIALWSWVGALPDEQASAKTVLHVRLAQWERVPGKETDYRLGVYNAGPGVADNLEVVLLGVDPRPRAASFRGRFPYHLRNSLGDKTGVRINEGSEEMYDVVYAWRNPEGAAYVRGVDGWDESHGIAMDTDEAFTLHIRISAANAEARDEEVLVASKGNQVSVSLKPAAPRPSPSR